MNLTLTEQLMYSTVKIETFYEDGSRGSGTGFTMEFKKSKDGFIPVLITNKHVVENSVEGRLTFTLMDKNGKVKDGENHEVVYSNFESRWIKHPNPDIDLCYLPLENGINHLKASGIEVFLKELPIDIIPTSDEVEGLDMLEEIVMIGYPNGIWDDINNKPIFRTGTTATHPKLDYRGKKEFVIDMACFPGSSGSPVLLVNQGSYIAKHGDIMMGQNRIYLLGVLYAGPCHNVKGEVEVVPIVDMFKGTSETRIPNSLGYVIKSSEILELEKLLK